MTWITPEQKVEIAKDIYCALLKTLSDVSRSPVPSSSYAIIAKQSIKALDEFINAYKDDGLIS